MFSKTVEYALRAVVHLAQESPQAKKTSDIATATKVPSAYLPKILQSLRSAGVVNLQRGVGGGVSLAKSPEDLTILDVVNAVEPIERITTCPLGLKSHGTHLCALHKQMDNVIEQMETAFANMTVAKLLASPNRSIPLRDSRKKKK